MFRQGQVLMMPGEGIRYPGAGVTGSGELPSVDVSKTGLVQEQNMLLTTELSLHLALVILKLV